VGELVAHSRPTQGHLPRSLKASPRRNAADDSVAVARTVRDFAGTWNIKSRSGTCAGPSAES